MRPWSPGGGGHREGLGLENAFGDTIRLGEAGPEFIPENDSGIPVDVPAWAMLGDENPEVQMLLSRGVDVGSSKRGGTTGVLKTLQKQASLNSRSLTLIPNP